MDVPRLAAEGSGIRSGDDLVLAVDIGGTKMAVGLVDWAGHLRWSSSAPTPQGADAETLWSHLVALLGSVPDGPPPLACGVGCGGPMEGGDAVSPLNIPGWRGFPLHSRLAGLTGVDTWVENDAKALALGEGWCGAAHDRRNYLSMVVSTGVGAGIVLDGRLLDGALGNAGHIGHVVVEPEGHRCVCGGQGCLEAEASGLSIARDIGAPPETAGLEVRRRVGILVGRAVASVANLLDLRLATVAGSVALGYGEPFFAAAQEEIDRRARLVFSRGCRIVAGGLGSEGPLVGAGALAWRGLGRSIGVG
ncbi:MAG: ROK family protein [Acidimicrobiaceae bacterium]|nr:ROK family protein [Acidimicrobiaceae bacterium]